MSKSDELLLLGEVGQRLHVQAWTIRTLIDRGLVPEATRVGRYRAVPASVLPKVEALLREHGYLKG